MNRNKKKRVSSTAKRLRIEQETIRDVTPQELAMAARGCNTGSITTDLGGKPGD